MKLLKVSLSPVLAILTLASCAHAPPPAKSFPQFVGRKSNLEHVTLLCEVCVWQNMEGDTERILLDETSALGSVAERWMKDGLVAKGYPVDASAFLSTGILPGKWTRAPTDTTAGSPDDPSGVFSTPFIRDTTPLRNPAMVSAWMGMLRRLFWLDDRFPARFYEPKPGESPAFVTEAVVLCDSLGGGAVALLRLDFWEERRGHAIGPSRDLNFFQRLMNPIVFGPATTLELTLVDGTSGEVLWHEGQFKRGRYDRKVIETMMSKVIENLP